MFKSVINTQSILTHCYGPVYRYHSQYGHEPGNSAEAESKPATSRYQLLKASCSGVNGQGPCFKMASTGDRNDPSFQATSFSGVASQGSRSSFLQMADASPDIAPTLYSRPVISRSNLVQNMQSVVNDKNAEYDPSNPHIASYGSVYRLLKPHNAFSTSRTAPSVSYKPPSRSSIRTTTGSEPNDYKAGVSKISYDGTQLKDAYNSASYISRNKPSLSSMVISSGPIIRFIMPNQSNDLLEQTTNETQSSFEPDGSNKQVMFNQPTSKPFGNTQIITYPRPTSQSQAPQYLPPETIKMQIIAPNNHLAPTPQLGTTEPNFRQQGNAYSSADTTFNPFTVFKPAQTTYMEQTSKQIQSSHQQADSPQDIVHDSISTSSPLSGPVYRFTRPDYVYGTSIRTGAYVNMPFSRAKIMQSKKMQDYQAGRSFPRVGFGSSSSVMASGDSTYGFAQLENAYTSDSQPTAGNSNLIQNPYFKSMQGQSSYSMFKPYQPSSSLPTWYMQMPSKSFNAPISQRISVQNSHPVLVSKTVPNGDQRKYHQKPDLQTLLPFQSHLYTPKNLFYLSSLPLPTKQSVSSNSNQLQPGKSESAHLANDNAFQTMKFSSKSMRVYNSSTPSLVSQGLARLRSDSDRVRNGYVLDQSGVSVKPSQISRPLSSSISSLKILPVSLGSWYGPSQPDQGFFLRGLRPVLNYQKVSFTRPL
ncbi:hypothetical protein C0J50_17512 [Silurus asotus]|uniref:Uncharacterized protein n=1 Tax=Silurus asotus TaxID=30991 RepID=A0AAD5FMY5_SILAS|nr:hypothetical protein C0J50_17512 [Silurus asotus]